MKLLRVLIALFTMALVGHSHADSVNGESCKEMENRVHKVFLTLTTENLSLSKTELQKLQLYYRDHALSKNRACGIEEGYDCRYKRDMKAFQTMTTYLDELRQAKKAGKPSSSVTFNP